MDAVVVRAWVDDVSQGVSQGDAQGVAQALAASGAQVQKHFASLDKLLPEERKEWHYQFSEATHACNAKPWALLEIVECVELDEFD